MRASKRSDALRVVESTYSAVIARLSPDQATVLQEEWAQYRHSELLGAFADLAAEGLRGFSQADTTVLLSHESRNRTIERLRSFRLEDDALDRLTQSLPAIALAPDAGEVVSLVGPFGAGKSEQAENWFFTMAQSYGHDDSAPLPIWFHASALSATAVADAVRARCDEREGPLHVALVVDGLDEIDPGMAAQIAQQVRVLVGTHAGCRAVMTLRPGTLPPDENDVQCAGLDNEAVERVIEIVAGRNVQIHGWSRNLRESVRRPFFAIAAGQAVRDGMSVSGDASLISHLVERALDDPSTRTAAVARADIYRLLLDLAKGLTDSGSQDDGLTYQQRQQVRSSRLIRINVDRAEFTLPIFQQWFAAQLLLDDLAEVRALAANPVSFGRWRWAFAVAGIAATIAQLDELLENLISGNPGAGAWVQMQIAAGHPRWRAQEEPPLRADGAKPRLLKAARIWISAFGGLAPRMYPVLSSSTPITLGVAVHGSRVVLGFSAAASSEDRVVDLPAQRSPTSGPWHIDFSGTAPAGPEWPWRLLISHASTRLEDLLSTGVLGSSDGVWRDERRHQLLRLLLDDTSVFYRPVDRKRALAAVEALLRAMPDPATTDVQLRRTRAHGTEIVDLRQWLLASDDAEVRWPVPTADILAPTGGWTWDLFSEQRLADITLRILERACEAYDEARSTWFPEFGWSLGTGEPGKFGVLAELQHPSHDKDQVGPTLHYMVTPLPELEEEVRLQRVPFVLSSNGRAAVAAFRATDARRQGYLNNRVSEWWSQGTPLELHPNPFVSRSFTDMVFRSATQLRPASEFAAHWLWNDFKAIGLASGTGPRFE